MQKLLTKTRRRVVAESGVVFAEIPEGKAV